MMIVTNQYDKIYKKMKVKGLKNFTKKLKNTKLQNCLKNKIKSAFIYFKYTIIK